MSNKITIVEAGQYNFCQCCQKHGEEKLINVPIVTIANNCLKSVMFCSECVLKMQEASK